MNIIEILLLPFVYIYKIVKTVLLLPYYFIYGISKLFNGNVKKEKKTISEIKPGEPVKVIKEVRSAYEESKINKEANDSIELANVKSQMVAETQAEYEKIIKRMRIDEQKKLQEQDRMIKDLVQKETEAKKKQEALKALEAKKEAEDAMKLEEIKEGKQSESISERLKASIKEKRFNRKKELELKAKRDILVEQFKDKNTNVSRLAEPILFNYLARTKDGVLEQSGIEALSRVDVYSFLLSEGYEVYEINAAKPSQNINIPFSFKRAKLIFYLSQLSAYLKSGIALADSVKILEQQAKNIKEKRAWRAVYYDLSMGDILSTAMEKRKEMFPRLLINMVKTAEMTGNLPETLDDMVDYYTEAETTKKQMKSALTYPILVLSFAFIVIVFIMLYVIPQFKGIYDSLGGQLPKITQITLSISNFLKSNIYFLILIITGIIVGMSLLYKYVKAARKAMQVFAMHMPIFGNIIIYNEVTIFSKTFANLINHNVFITDSMDVLGKITNNEVYKELIYKSTKNLTKGDPLSLAFKDNWAFPNIAYQMLITGEKTGRLGPMMEKVSDYYSEQHKSIINQMKTLLEPILIVLLATVVGFILLSVVVPMFDMYNQIQ